MPPSSLHLFRYFIKMGRIFDAQFRMLADGLKLAEWSTGQSIECARGSLRCSSEGQRRVLRESILFVFCSSDGGVVRMTFSRFKTPIQIQQNFEVERVGLSG